MATYKGVKGFTIQSLSADPPAPILGQVWYNSTSNVLKGYTTVSAAWSSGGDYPQSQSDFAGAGTKTAGLAWSGEQSSRVVTSTYDGTSWTTSAPMNYPTDLVTQAGFGLQTAAISAGGYVPPNATVGATAAASLFDGSTWSGIPSLNQALTQPIGVGTSTAGLVFGGNSAPSPTPASVATDEYNGTAWTAGGDLGSSTREGAQHIGTQTAAIAVAGGVFGPPSVAELVTVVQQYNGTSWSDLPAALNTSRFRSGGSGISTDAIVFGGATGTPSENNDVANTESFDGSTWTEVADLASVKSNFATSGTTSIAALCIGGQPVVGVGTETEVWTGAGDSIVTFTSS